MDFLKKFLPKGAEKYLRGIGFPIRKQELIRRLRQNGAPGPIVDQASKRLPEGEYRNIQDVIKNLTR